MANNIPTPHISAKEGEIAPSILLPGDPLRAKYIAENFLAGAKQFNSTRNMFGYTGFYRDKPISVMGTGHGLRVHGHLFPRADEFLWCKEAGACGHCRSHAEDHPYPGSVLAMGACTGTGYVKELGLPDGYSCIADFGLLIKAALEAEQRGLSYHVGNVLTSDVFYAPEKAKKEGVGYEDVGVLAAEMETAALYANAALAGAQALSILTISDSLITGESTTAEERQNSFMDMVQVALEIL